MMAPGKRTLACSAMIKNLQRYLLTGAVTIIPL